MKSFFSFVVLAVLVLAALAGSVRVAESQTAAGTQDGGLMFVENKGQFDPQVRFQAQGANGTLWVTEDGLWISVVETTQGGGDAETQGWGDTEMWGGPIEQPGWGVALKITFPEATPRRVEPFHLLETQVSYFLGNDPSKWVSGAPVWAGVRYVDLYPGIDLELSGQRGLLAPKLVVREGAALERVRMRVEGGDAVDVVDRQIQVETVLGPVTFPLLATEGVAADSLPEAARVEDRVFDLAEPFALPGTPASNDVGAMAEAVAAPLKTTIIFNTYLGGTDDEWTAAVAADPSGNTFVCGGTTSSDFPPRTGTFPFLGGDEDVFIVKYSASGQRLATAFMGGGGYDSCGGLALAADGRVYATGQAEQGFPVSQSGVWDSSHHGGWDVFVARFDNTLNNLNASTFMGGRRSDRGLEIVLGGNGNVYVSGDTYSDDFPSTTGYAYRGGGDGFAAALDAGLTTRLWAIYLGGSNKEEAVGMVVRDSFAYVTGPTYSADFPTKNAFDSSFGNVGDEEERGDGFVTKLDPNGGLVYSTYLGGDGDEWLAGIAVDSSNQVHVVGGSEGGTDDGYPITEATAYQPALRGARDAVLTVLNAAGSTLVYSTFLGGQGRDEAGGIALDGAGNDYIIGRTLSNDFPVKYPYQAYKTGIKNDAFVAIFQSAGGAGDASLLYSTYFGGSDADFGENIALNGDGSFLLSIATRSSDWRLVNPDDNIYGGERDVFVVKASVENRTTRTLILTSRSQMETLFGASDAGRVMGKLSDLAAHTDVDGVVVNLDKYQPVAAAYAARGANYEDKERANALAGAIKEVITQYRTGNSDLRFMVLAGDDRIIPFYRLIDGVPLTQPLYAPEWTLTDDFYAAGAGISCPACANPSLYVPSLAVGRLVEKPGQIIGTIDAFLADSTIDYEQAVVTAYNEKDRSTGEYNWGYLSDGADQQASLLRGAGLATDALISHQQSEEIWGKTEFMNAVFNPAHELNAILAHSDATVLCTPYGCGANASDIQGVSANLAGFVFNVFGCHAGLSRYNIDSDLTEAFASKGANYVADTGYSNGYPGVVAWSEAMTRDFTRELVAVRSGVVGQALMRAKQNYYQTHKDSWDVVHEKAVSERTLYGLPMYRYSLPAGAQAEAASASPAVITTSAIEPLWAGLSVQAVNYDIPPLAPHQLAKGSYYSLGDDFRIRSGEPVQPVYLVDVTRSNERAHGLVFKGGTFEDKPGYDPVVMQPFNEYIGTWPEPGLGEPRWYPSQLQSLILQDGRDHLKTSLAQYHASSHFERVFTQLSYEIYYHSFSSDWTKPVISDVQGSLKQGVATVNVRVTDETGIEAVFVAFTSGTNRWRSGRLTGNGDTWSGTFPANANTNFFIQAVDGAGNVGVADNNGQYYFLATNPPDPNLLGANWTWAPDNARVDGTKEGAALRIGVTSADGSGCWIQDLPGAAFQGKKVKLTASMAKTAVMNGPKNVVNPYISLSVLRSNGIWTRNWPNNTRISSSSTPSPQNQLIYVTESRKYKDALPADLVTLRASFCVWRAMPTALPAYAYAKKLGLYFVPAGSAMTNVMTGEWLEQEPVESEAIPEQDTDANLTPLRLGGSFKSEAKPLVWLPMIRN